MDVTSDFEANADRLIDWLERTRDEEQALRFLPLALVEAVDLVFCEQAAKLSHLFTRADLLCLGPAPTRAAFVSTETFAALRERWSAEYLQRRWLRWLRRTAEDCGSRQRGERAGVLHSRLRQRIKLDLQDLSRRQDPAYEYTRQQVNRAARKGGYARRKLNGTWHVGPVGLEPPSHRVAEDAQIAGLVHGADSTSVPRGKMERAEWWLRLWFDEIPDAWAATWRVVHELLRLVEPERGGAADATPHAADEADADDRVAAADLLRKIRRRFGSRLDPLLLALSDTGALGVTKADWADELRAMIFEASGEELERAPIILRCLLEDLRQGAEHDR